MGNLGAIAISEAVQDGSVSIRSALTWQLRSNHYPPLPYALIDVAEKAIELGNVADWSAEIDLPEGITFRDDRPVVTVADAIETLHLDGFLDYNIDDEY